MLAKNRRKTAVSGGGGFAVDMGATTKIFPGFFLMRDFLLYFRPSPEDVRTMQVVISFADAGIPLVIRDLTDNEVKDHVMSLVEFLVE